MGLYQKLIDFQNEVELVTGFRPMIHIGVHPLGEKTNEECQAIRELIVEDSGEGLNHVEVKLEGSGLGQWTAYKAQDFHRAIDVTVHGPVVKEKREVFV